MPPPIDAKVAMTVARAAGNYSVPS